MDRIQTLTLLFEREQSLRDAALMDLRQAQNAEAAMREQTRTLEVYRDEYRARWSAQFATSSTMDIMRCYQGFVARLDQAIAQQAGAEHHAAQQVVVAQHRLRRHETRVATVRRLIARRQQTMASKAERREAKAADEFSQRMLWARRKEVAQA